MDASVHSSEALVCLDPIDIKTPIIKELETHYIEVKKLLVTATSDGERSDILSRVVTENSRPHLQSGLLYLILLREKNHDKVFQLLLLASKESRFVDQVNALIDLHWQKLMDTPRKQILWLLAEMMRSNTQKTDVLLLNLLKRISGGDLSSYNIWLIENLISILNLNYRNWLIQNTMVVPYIVYTFLRLIQDHCNCNANRNMQPRLENLRKLEIPFTLMLLREFFKKCMEIGRDLVRLLQGVSRIPEFEQFWREMLYTPSTLSPNFSGITQLLALPTNRHMAAIRLTPDMEKRLLFVSSKVRMGTEHRYLEWLQRRYLSTPEAQSLRVDWIRWLCLCVHPSNQELHLGLGARWQFINWIISTCTCPVTAANCKLALFYDWLFFVPKSNVMLYEPAMLLLFHVIQRHSSMAYGILDFLLRITDHFFPPMKDVLRDNVQNAFKYLIQMKVVPTIQPMFDTTRLPSEIINAIRAKFPEISPIANPGLMQDATLLLPPATPIYDSVMASGLSLRNEVSSCALTPPLSVGPTPPSTPGALEMECVVGENDMFSTENMIQQQQMISSEIVAVSSSSATARRSIHLVAPAAGGDVVEPEQPEVEDDALSNADSEELRREFVNMRVRFLYAVERVDIQPLLEGMSEGFREHMLRLQNNKDLEERCEIMGQLANDFINEDPDNFDLTSNVAKCICELCFEDFQKQLFPKKVTEQSLKLSISTPIFILFEALYALAEDDPMRQSYYLLLSEMHTLQPRIGYFLLYFLKVQQGGNNSEMRLHSWASYQELARSLPNPDEERVLLQDLELLAHDDRRLFVFLLPDLITHFQSYSRSPAFVRLVVSNVDAARLQDLLCAVLMGRCTLFSSGQQLVNLLHESLHWTTLEQCFLWQLLNAQDLPSVEFIRALQFVDFAKHPEATSNLLLTLRLDAPSAEVVYPLLLRPAASGDHFMAALLCAWSVDRKTASRLAELLQDVLTGRVNKITSNSKRRSTPNDLASTRPTAVHVLTHLENVRQNGGNQILLQHPAVQQGLEEAARSISESDKFRFSNLLALAVDEDEEEAEWERGYDATTFANARGSGAARVKRERNTYDHTTTETLSNNDVAAVGKSRRQLRNVASRRAAAAAASGATLTSSRRACGIKRTAANDDIFDSDGTSSSEEDDAINLQSGSNSGEVSGGGAILAASSVSGSSAASQVKRARRDQDEDF